MNQGTYPFNWKAERESKMQKHHRNCSAKDCLTIIESRHDIPQYTLCTECRNSRLDELWRDTADD